MTRRTNMICLALFFICVVITMSMAIYFPGRTDASPFWVGLFNILGIAMIGLLPFSVGSFILTKVYEQVYARDTVYDPWLRRNPICVLIWREVLDPSQK